MLDGNLGYSCAVDGKNGKIIEKTSGNQQSGEQEDGNQCPDSSLAAGTFPDDIQQGADTALPGIIGRNCILLYEIVDRIGVKTVEASVFDMIDLICRKKPVKAVEKLNNLFELRTDEIAILGAMTTSFVDMHRCKMAQSQRKDYNRVQKDFEKNANSYRYKKAMNNASNFSLSSLEDILSLLMKTDISMKSSARDKKQMLYVLVTQIIAKGAR